MMSYIVFSYLLLTLAMAANSSKPMPWDITTAMPSQVVFKQYRSVTVLMKSNRPLESCQCRTYWNERDVDRVIDLSRGKNSERDDRVDKYNARYSGTGLEHGECGLVLRNVKPSLMLLVCRARRKVGQWKYQYVELLAEQMAQFNMTGEQRHVVLPGSTAALNVCKAETSLDFCSILLSQETESAVFTKDNQTVGRYKYHGSGMKNGECGVAFNVSEGDNGLAWCRGRSRGRDSVLSTMFLVAVPPSTVYISFPSGNSSTSGGLLTATCTVSPSRPVANITWLLGDQVIRRDQVDDDDYPYLDWSWPWDKKMLTQTLIHRVKTEDNNKELICRVEHAALKAPLESLKKIAVAA